MTRSHLISLILVAGMLTTGVEAQPPAANETQETVYEMAVANPSRSDADRARDAGRQPAEIMAFFGIEPGMRVLDMFSGGGYYAELLAYVVGDSGQVIAHSNAAYANYVGKEAVARYENDRLPNVSIVMAENNEWDWEPARFDAVTMVLSYHDVYFVDAASGWPEIDGPAMLKSLYKTLKPGGILGVVDHAAAKGSPRETGGTLHRIDPAIVIEELEAAGFVLEASSDVLANAEDDHTRSMGDPAIRGKTDRFVMRFRKPNEVSAP